MRALRSSLAHRWLAALRRSLPELKVLRGGGAPIRNCRLCRTNWSTTPARRSFLVKDPGVRVEGGRGISSHLQKELWSPWSPPWGTLGNPPESLVASRQLFLDQTRLAPVATSIESGDKLGMRRRGAARAPNRWLSPAGALRGSLVHRGALGGAGEAAILGGRGGTRRHLHSDSQMLADSESLSLGPSAMIPE